MPLMVSRFAALGLLAATLGGLAVAAACNDPEQYVFSAAPFDTTNLCLGPYQAVDVVSGGSGASTCAPKCFVNAGAVYVSTVCPPFPDPTVWDESGLDPNCPAALSAFARMDTCFPDGGSSNPWIMVDGSPPPPDDAAEGGTSTDDGATDDSATGDDGATDDGAGGSDAPATDGATD
jgi:hypothetical protein